MCRAVACSDIYYIGHRRNNIASEASQVYILSGQKLIKNAKNGVFKKTVACGQTVLLERSI